MGIALSGHYFIETTNKIQGDDMSTRGAFANVCPLNWDPCILTCVY